MFILQKSRSSEQIRVDLEDFLSPPRGKTAANLAGRNGWPVITVSQCGETAGMTMPQKKVDMPLILYRCFMGRVFRMQ